MKAADSVNQGQTRPRKAALRLGMVKLVATIVVGAAISWFFVKTSLPQQRNFAAAGRASGRTYWKSGRWRADARTLADAIRYVFEPERQWPNQSNQTAASSGYGLGAPGINRLPDSLTNSESILTPG